MFAKEHSGLFCWRIAGRGRRGKREVKVNGKRIERRRRREGMVWWRQRNMAQGRDDQLFIQEYLPRFSAAGYYWPYLPPNNQNQLMVKWKQDKAKPRLVRDDFSRGHPHPGRDQGPEQRSGVVCGSGLWTPDLQNGERLFPCAHLPHLNPNPGPRPPCYPHEEWAWMQTEPHRQTQMDARTRGSITNRYMPTAERAVWR